MMIIAEGSRTSVIVLALSTTIFMQLMRELSELSWSYLGDIISKISRNLFVDARGKLMAQRFRDRSCGGRELPCSDQLFHR